MRVANFYEGVLLFLTCLTIVVQMYSIFMMLFKSPKNMSEYGKLLAYVTLWDLIFGVVLGIIFAPGLFFPVPGMILNGLGDNLANIYGYDVNRIVVRNIIVKLI